MRHTPKERKKTNSNLIVVEMKTRQQIETVFNICMYRTVMLKYKIIRMTHNKRIVKCEMWYTRAKIYMDDDFYTAVNIYLGVYYIFIRLQESLKQTLEHYI